MRLLAPPLSGKGTVAGQSNLPLQKGRNDVVDHLKFLQPATLAICRVRRHTTIPPASGGLVTVSWSCSKVLPSKVLPKAAPSFDADRVEYPNFSVFLSIEASTQRYTNLIVFRDLAFESHRSYQH